MCEIHKILVLSTAHITEETSEWLIEEGYTNDEYGFWLYCKSDSMLKSPEVPSELKKVLIFAASKDCAYVKLDRDGDTVSGLNTFDW